MSLASRVLARAGFGTGAVATTALLVGGFAVTNGNVNIGTLTGKDRSSEVQPTLAADLGTTPSGTADDPATQTPSSSPTPTAAMTRPATPSEPDDKRTSSTSRSVSARASITPKPSASSTAADASDAALAQEVLAQINTARRVAGLPALTMSAGLVRSAAAHNAVMAGGCGLSHQCSGESDLGKRISAQGVKWTAAGENIGQGGPEPSSPEAIVSMAKQLTTDMLAETAPNDGHRKNILSTSFKHAGIALYRDGKGMVWMTQDFSS